ncbi:MAG: ROK family protein, partial [Lachnospiraceae bacterium]|nr:ROK family protein [Lachnospiraceae bacterium]
ELRGVGRGSLLYSIDDEHEYYILVNISVQKEHRIIDYYVVSATGNIIQKSHVECEVVKVKDIAAVIEKFMTEYSSVNQIVLSIPGVIDSDEIEFSDIKELEGAGVKEKLQEQFDKNISIENDMHCIAYGYKDSRQDKSTVITLASFPSHIQPGTVTMHKGQIISGCNGIAGLAGFMPLGISPDEIPDLMVEGKSTDIISRIVGAVIAFNNPEKIVFSGELISEKVLTEVTEYCSKSVPAKYMPKFKMVTNFDEFLINGMFQIAIENKKL